LFLTVTDQFTYTLWGGTDATALAAAFKRFSLMQPQLLCVR